MDCSSRCYKNLGCKATPQPGTSDQSPPVSPCRTTITRNSGGTPDPSLSATPKMQERTESQPPTCTKNRAYYKATHRGRAPRQWRKRANEFFPDTRSQVRPARRAIRTHFAKHHAIRTRKCRNKPNPSHRPAQKIERITKQTHRRPRHPSRSRKRRNEPFRLPQPLRHGSPKA